MTNVERAIDIAKPAVLTTACAAVQYRALKHLDEVTYDHALETSRLKGIIEGLTRRIAAQAELLARRAEACIEDFPP